MASKRILVFGKVQGVGFRKACFKRARELKLKGWVRNLSDGRVEIYASGPDEDLRELENWAQKGPLLARVSKIEVTIESEESNDEFWIRRDET